MKNTKLISILLLVFLNIQTPAYSSIFDKPKIIKDISREASSCMSGGCDPDKMIKMAMKGHISNATEGFTDEVQESIIEASDHIFDKQIDPLIERTAVLATKIIEKGGAEAQLRANNIIEKAVTDIVDSFDPWVTKAVGLGNEAIRVADEGVELAGQFTPEKIKEELITTTFNRLDKLEKSLFTNANNFISEIICAVDGQTGKVEQKIIDNLLASITGLSKEQKQCIKNNEITSETIKLHYLELYEIEKCIIENNINLEKKTNTIIRNYKILATNAAKYRCINRIAGGEAEKDFIQDWLDYNYKAQVWKKIYNLK
ncbi:MAG: hypothetical protein AAGE84_09205 [Cyanobacteria bacterium P01_G01_bin.39]